MLSAGYLPEEHFNRSECTSRPYAKITSHAERRVSTEPVIKSSKVCCTSTCQVVLLLLLLLSSLLLLFSPPALQHAMAPFAPTEQPAAHSRLFWVLLVGAAVLFGALLSQVAAAAPWGFTPAAVSCWQPHSNHTDRHAAAPQEQQQLQEQVQQLKQQYQQQLLTLSTLQTAQLQLQASVQALRSQQLSGQLAADEQASFVEQVQLLSRNTSTQGLQQQQQQQQQQSRRRNTTQPHQGIICTVLRNEARYVPEWVAFHLLMGATKVVIYDDNSTDSLRDAAAAFGDSVVVVDMLKDVKGVPGDNAVHRVSGRQGEVGV
jgi:hypothetical protein